MGGRNGSPSILHGLPNRPGCGNHRRGICYHCAARCIGLTERVRPYRNAEGASFRPETLRQQDGRPWMRCLRTVRLRRALESGAPLFQGHPPKGSGAKRAPDLSGHRTDGRHVHQQCRLLIWRTRGTKNTAFRAASGTGRPHRRFRRLGHARSVRFTDWRTSRRTARSRRL